MEDGGVFLQETATRHMGDQNPTEAGPLDPGEYFVKGGRQGDSHLICRSGSQSNIVTFVIIG